jgi:amino acid adenylation domain-containing protein/non-ribosomal peptide synthase protein (TIGR01720 family)
MALLAAFDALLSRLGGKEDLVVGSPVANRGRLETEGLIGLFVNTLALRGDLAGDPGFSELVRRTREAALGAYVHQELPFEKLVDELRIERDLTHSPLFQVMLVLQNAPAEALTLPDLALRLVPTAEVSAKFDLTLYLTETPGALAATWEYDPDLFDAPTVQRMAAGFEVLLGGLLARPEERLSGLPLLRDAESHQLVTAWNDTAAALPPVCIHEVFAAQAALTPEAPALVFEGETLGYGELDRRADQVAHHLLRRGARPGDLVGVLMERSIEMVAALLGVLKAGCAYVPLDPGYPRERLAFMLEDCGMPLVLAQERLRGALPEGTGQVVCLDSEWERIACESATGLTGLAGPDSVAYAIYTSGSTGRPKGAMNSHRGIANRLLWMQDRYRLDGSDRVLQKTPYSFDVSVWEFFWPLTTGACLVVARPEGHRDPGYLVRLIVEAEITTLHFVPSMLHAFLEQEGVERCTSLRRVMCSGEALSFDLQQRFFARLGAELHNLYGPTEAAVDVTSHACEPGDRRGIVPIGRPIANLQIHIVDRALRPVPAGVPGELLIGGVGLGLGYLRRPALTAERFIPNPLSEEPGTRLYRTGDLARHLPDGAVEFLGRLDFQVKIRGFRIELGEIEAALGEIAEVAQAVVVARSEVSESGRLVAYVVPRRGAHLEMAALRQALQRRLPEFMVPAAFVVLPEMPLTFSGKVDRRALPAPEVPHSQEPEAGPRTAAEAALAGIWSALLRRDRVGLHDNFFALGGDSILAIQVVARAARAGYRITPKQMFEHQTIAALAQVAVATVSGEIPQGPVVGTVALTPFQRLFLDGDPIDPHHFNQALLLTVRAPLTPAVTAAAFAALLRHHDALRLRFARSEEGWRAWSAGPEEQAPMVRLDLTGLAPSRRVAALEAAAAEAQGSLDLTSGPLARCCWLELAPGDARLLLLIHHLAVDGVSWRVLLEDLQTACLQLLDGEAISLPAKTTSFQAWAERLTEHARALPLESELSWWLGEAEGAPVRLPIDQPAAADTEASAGWVSVALTAEETRCLLQEVPSAYRTQINDVLLTALALALAAPGESDSVLVDLEGHGREEIAEGIDLSRTVGWFTTVFPVRLTTDRGADLGAALKGIKEHLRAVPGRGIGHGLLRYLRGDAAVARRLDELPRADVRFNYLGQLDQALPESALFGPAGETAGPMRSPRALRSHTLDINAFVGDGCLRVDWAYGTGRHRGATVEAVAERFLLRLREIISHCRAAVAARTGGYTPSDFPLAAFGAEELERVVGSEWGIEDVYPLSPLQEGLLFHSLYEPGSGVYVQQLLCRTGDLDEETFAAACREALAAVPVLRTSFHWHGLSRPVQVVHGALEPVVERDDWRALPASEQSRRLEILLREEREGSFDLSRAPLMRWRLVRITEEQHWLLWSSHHLLLDGWSLYAVIAELLSIYADLRARRAPQPRRRRPYRDYIAWLERRDGAAAEAFWRRELAGFTAPTPLGLGHEPAGEAAGSASRHSQLPEELSAGLRELAGRHQLTLNTVVQAVWALLLAHQSGERDVVFGGVSSGRSAPLAGIEEIVGLFINTLPVRSEVVPGARLSHWLRGLLERQVEARQHEHTPLAQVQGWSEVPRGRALFDSILAFENFPLEESLVESTGRDGLSIESVEFLQQNSFPLTIVVSPGRRLDLKITYDLRRFDSADVERMLAHLQALLAGMLAETDPLLGELSPSTAAERHQLLEWNDTGREAFAIAAGEDTLAGLFSAWARRIPDATAVVFAGERLTYGELDERSNQVAWHLRRLGVGPDVAVGLLLHRGLEMMIGMLGILKAGGAYVPLDPASPVERLRFMVEDALGRSGSPVLLTLERWAGKLPQPSPGVHSALADLRVLCLDTDAPAIAAEHRASPPPAALPGNLAYVLYTSGSTGRPKGVAVEHRQIVNYTRALCARLDLAPGFSYAMVQPLTVDSSNSVVYPALFGGGCLHVLSESDSTDPLALAEYFERHPIDVLKIAPTHLAALEASLPAGKSVLPLGWLVVGGEASRRDWGERMLATARCRTTNHYGPTETTVGILTFPITERLLRYRSATVPVGRPLANDRAYVADRELRPVAPGVAGELLLGGGGVARGYLGRPDLTAEKFIPDPFGGEPGGRLYRTGDVARFHPDGDLEFLGRNDHQIKIRGFRVEPGEIEALLIDHPHVAQALVVGHAGRGGEARLVAYVVPASQRHPAADELRGFLADRLPGHMVPAAFVTLASLPQTPQGKVNRLALPAPDWSGEEAAEPTRLRTPLEELLAGIFAAVLHRDHVAAEDDFFALGGHSLLAMQLVSRVRDGLSVELPIRAVFEEPTVAGLARRIESESAHAVPPPLQPVPREGDLPLSFVQQRLWAHHQIRSESAVYNIHTAFRLRGALRVPVLAAALAEMVGRHESLRTRFAARPSGEAVQVVEPARPLDLPLVDLSLFGEVEGLERARHLSNELGLIPFDLGRGPLLRVCLLRLGAEDHAFLVTMHHIVSDGWSMDLFVREMATLYAAFADGRPSPLAPPRLQYADFAAWQRRWLQGDVLDGLVEGWKRRLAGAPPVVMPVDRPRPPVPSERGAVLPLAVPAELTRGLEALARREGSTLYMLLLAAFKTLLHSFSGQEDMVVGSNVAGRHLLETEGMIGFFVNMLVLRTDLSGNPAFRTLLRRVREVVLAAYTGQDVPLDRLARELRLKASGGGSPLFQAVLSLHNTPEPRVDVAAGLALSIIPFAVDTTPFDLVFNLRPSADGLRGGIQYSLDLFDAMTIERLRDRFIALLALIVARPEASLGEMRKGVIEAGSRPVAAKASSEALFNSALANARRRSTRRPAKAPAAVPLRETPGEFTDAE